MDVPTDLAKQLLSIFKSIWASGESLIERWEPRGNIGRQQQAIKKDEEHCKSFGSSRHQN